MTDKLPPTIDFHVPQNDGTSTALAPRQNGPHCQPTTPTASWTSPRCAAYWLKDPQPQHQHICWDGCMSNAVLKSQRRGTHLGAMLKVRRRAGVLAHTRRTNAQLRLGGPGAANLGLQGIFAAAAISIVSARFDRLLPLRMQP